MAGQRRPEPREQLQRRVEELTFDIGRILHANTSTLLMVNRTLDAVAHALEPELAPARGSSIGGDPLPLVHERAGQLAQALQKLLSAGSEEQRHEALPEADWARLASQVEMLQEYETRVGVAEARPSVLRTIASRVGALVRAIPKGHLPREPTRAAVRAAAELERLTCFCAVLATRQGVIQMDATLRALRDFITSDVRTREEPKRVSLSTLVREATVQLRDFADATGVDFVWRHRDDDLEVVGNERDLVRAVANLVHNAIKYSWRREAGRAPWVAIRTIESDDGVAIEVESWGVPVSENEIEQGLVFELGYRGKWSTDRGRLGTGIGLTDARRAALAHGGDVSIESRPASGSGLRRDDTGYYKQPFLTRVTLTLPRG